MNRFLISVIVPCYNQAQYLDEALESVFNQTYNHWECIIVNDGSPDNTEEVAKKWCDKDSRFRYFYKKNGGLSSARNFGLDNALGNYIQFLDSDDVIEKNKFEVSLVEFQNIFENRIKIAISNFRMFTNDINVTNPPFCILKREFFTFNKIVLGWDTEFNIPIHCGFFEYSFFEKFRFNEELKAKEDWILWIELFKMNPIVLFVDKSLAYYRIHNQSMTNNRQFMVQTLIEAFSCLTLMITKDMLNELLLRRLKESFEESNELEKKYRKVKDSNSFKLGLKIKSMLKRFYLLFFARKLLKIFRY